MFVVKVTETLLDETVVEAANPHEAINKAVKKYLAGELLPTSERYMNVNFEVKGEGI